MTAGYGQDEFGFDYNFEEDDDMPRNEEAPKQLFSITLETQDVYEEGPWTLAQVISAIESEVGLKVLDVSEIYQHDLPPKDNEVDERPPRRSRT